MITTVLGTCDYCGKERDVVASCESDTMLTQFACLECRDENLDLRKEPEPSQ